MKLVAYSTGIDARPGALINEHVTECAGPRTSVDACQAFICDHRPGEDIAWDPTLTQQVD